MELVKKFNSYEEYEDFKHSDEYEVPNVCVIETLDTIDVKYNQNDPFWIEALEDVNVNYYYTSTSYGDYSYDKVNWTKFTASGVTLRTGKKLYLRHTSNNARLYVTGKYNVGGNILSLVYGSEYLEYKDHKQTFFPEDFLENARSVVSANELILAELVYYSQATGGAKGAYKGLFENCVLLKDAPKLPNATQHEHDAAFEGMFKNCSSLTKAPTIRDSNKESSHIFKSIFYGCTSLSFIKDLSTDPKTRDTWVRNVPSTGTFIASSKRSNFSRGDGYIPVGWDLYLYDEDNDRYVVRFQINSIPYELYTETPTDVIWSEFIESDHNTNNFNITTDGYIMKDEKYIWITETTVESGTTSTTTRRVVSTESIKLHYNYILKTL